MMPQDEVYVSPASRALHLYIGQALQNQKRARKKLKPGCIHDLRVALRRCWSLADGFSMIDPHSAWRRLRKVSKRQQQGLSDLRDVQVQRKWIKELQSTDGAAGEAFSRDLKKRSRKAEKEAQQSLRSFSRKRWKRWLERLPLRAELVPASDRRVAELVSGRLKEVIELHERWSKEANAEDWHELRVAVKQFRYILASFMPEKSEQWEREIKHTQDLLGEGHDLDVFCDRLQKLATKKAYRKDRKIFAEAIRNIRAAAARRQEEYTAFVSNPGRATGHTARVINSRETYSTIWAQWLAEIEASSANRQDGEEPSKSVPIRGLRVVAPANQYPDRQRRISSAR